MGIFRGERGTNRDRREGGTGGGSVGDRGRAVISSQPERILKQRRHRRRNRPEEMSRSDKSLSLYNSVVS